MRATQLLREEHEIILRALAVLQRQKAPNQELLSFFSEFADTHHHGKEEDILFPAMEEAGFPRDAGPVGVMLHEHDLGRQLLSAMRDPARFAEAMPQYVALLGGHIQKENQILFVMADRAVEDQRRVDEAFEAFEQQWTARRAKHEAAIARLEKQP